MFKHALIYSLKIWLSSVVVAPILYYVWTYNYSETFAAGNFFGFWALSIIYGLILSLPCYALFMLASFYLRSKGSRVLGKKIGLGLWAALLIIALTYVIFGHDDKVFLESTIKLAACHILSVASAIIYLRLPNKSSVLEYMKQKS